MCTFLWTRKCHLEKVLHAKCNFAERGNFENTDYLSHAELFSRNYLSQISGISRLRGTTLHELFLTYQQRGLNWYHNAKRGATDIISVFKVIKQNRHFKILTTSAWKKKLFQTAEDCLIKCIDTLQYEPAHQPEGKLLIQAREELEDLRDFVKNLTGWFKLNAFKKWTCSKCENI